MSSSIQSYIIRYQEQMNDSKTLVKIKVTNVQTDENTFFENVDEALSFIRTNLQPKRGEVVE
ncbi:hypothetical protein ACFFJI_10240 [Allobacillus sp. GCM10007491]|uniref:Uncharacterized protein n=1 Tax=Allobacillus saliphilus TaxID=2912308 RepID=A0A941CRY7_9BACI|nr:hypothetical protein [Allobacillus saliphilus]MBR7552604.1 hypothetical protein [Allobacillus saliphilus]